MRIVKYQVCLLLVTFFFVSISNTPVTGEKIAYKGKPGPQGFRPDEFRAYLTDRYLAQAKPQNEVAPRNQ